MAASACAFALVCFGFAQTASAQEWLKDRREQEGAGIRVGNFELHPGVGLEVGYDSNYFYRTDKNDPSYANGDVKAIGVLRVTPSFTISTLTGQRLEGGAGASQAVVFRGGASASYRELLSGDSDIRDQRNVALNAFARADVFQGRPLGFDVFANYSRTIQPSVAFNPDLAFNSDTIGAGADVVAIPGGGTFDIRAGYQFSGTLYEESNAAPYTMYTHEISVRDRWKFRPRTSLFADTTLRWNTYPNGDRALFYLDESTPLRSRIGLNGLLTDRFGLLLAVGYGASFFKKPDAFSTKQFDNITANAEGTVYLSRADGAGEPGQATLLLSKLVFGYSRDFSNSLLANYYTSNKGYARIEYFFTGRALITLEGYFEALSYPQPYYQQAGAAVVVGGTVNGASTAAIGDFTNYHVGGILYGEYRFTDVFALTADLDYSQTISDVALAVNAPGAPAAGAGGSLFDLSWKRFQALVGARFFF